MSDSETMLECWKRFADDLAKHGLPTPDEVLYKPEKWALIVEAVERRLVKLSPSDDPFIVGYSYRPAMSSAEVTIQFGKETILFGLI